MCIQGWRPWGLTIPPHSRHLASSNECGEKLTHLFWYLSSQSSEGVQWQVTMHRWSCKNICLSLLFGDLKELFLVTEIKFKSWTLLLHHYLPLRIGSDGTSPITVLRSESAEISLCPWPDSVMQEGLSTLVLRLFTHHLQCISNVNDKCWGEKA